MKCEETLTKFEFHWNEALELGGGYDHNRRGNSQLIT